MYITKTINTTVDLVNPSEIYEPNLEKLILSKLNEKYVGKCYMSILILKIGQIINMSSRNLVDNQLNGSAYVDVQFEVSGEMFIIDEVLHDCRIEEIHPNAITAYHKHAGIKLQRNSKDLIFKILKAGMNIPIVIKNIRYNLNRDMVSIMGVPFVPTVEKVAYFNINEQLSPLDVEKINDFLTQIEKEEKLHKEISKEKRYGVFKQLIHPYKTQIDYADTKEAKKLHMKPMNFDIKTFTNIAIGTTCHYSNIDMRFNRRFFITNDTIPDDFEDDNLQITTGAYMVFMEFLKKYLLYMQCLRGFVETYSTIKSMETMLIYWKICKTLQN